MEFIEEALTSPAFYLLGGGAVVTTVIGTVFAKKAEMPTFPWWQLAIVILAELLAAAFFVTKE